MRPGLRAFLGITLFLLLFSTTVRVVADEVTVNLQSKVLVSFDEPDKPSWIVQGSKFITKDFPEWSLVKTYPDAVFGKNKDNANLLSLGIHSRFDRKGYNYIEIIPAKKNAEGKLEPMDIPLPGRAQRLDVWVWGSNYKYTMDLNLRDYQGVDHVLHLGSLEFAGWKNLSATIPGSIMQARRQIPRFQGLVLTKLVIWTTPAERVDDNFIFIDQLNVLTDMFESRFDGDSLADPDYLEQIWSKGNNK